MSIAETVLDADGRWTNQLGLMNLSPNHAYVDNANDVLYSAVFCQLISMLSLKDDTHRSQAIAGCETHRIEPGNFVRFNHDHTVTNSHDNYDAISCLSKELAEEICVQGDKVGWDFNLKSDMPLNFTTLRQPGSIAFAQLCAERRPYLLNFACLIIGLLIGSFQFSKHTHHICWLRSQQLRKIASKYALDAAWRHLVIPLTITFIIFDIASILRFKNRHQAVVNYYAEEDHPNRRLALELIRKEAS